MKDYVELPEYGTVERVIWSEDDPLCGIFVHTEYIKDGEIVRKDLHLEVSKGAMLKGMVNI